MELCFEDELHFLKGSYDENEFSYCINDGNHILNFVLTRGESITFNIPDSYPQEPPIISLSIEKLTVSEKLSAEKEIRDYVISLKGSYMILDVVTEANRIVSATLPRKRSVKRPKPVSEEKEEETYMTVFLVDHINHKSAYIDALTHWVKELTMVGVFLCSDKQSFLIIQGFRKQLKEFISRFRMVCMDVDEKGHPCEGRMSKILFLGLCTLNFSNFSLHEISDIENLEAFCSERNLESIYQEHIRRTPLH